MMKFYLLFPVLLLVCCTNKSFSQTPKDTILLLNGEIISGKITQITGDQLFVKESENVVQDHPVDTDRIFSYTNTAGEHILYVQDTLVGNDFTIAEMRYFIRGEQDGKSGFRARPAFYTNLIIGAASGLTGSFFFPVPAFTFAILVGLPKVRIKKGTVRNPDDLNHPTYLMGYERMARRNRKIQSLIGGGIGVVAGMGTFLILQASDKQLIR